MPHALPSPAKATPAMRQYLEAKQQHPDAILFFRMGDFYEMFYQDALVAARALELTLTSRSKDGQGGSIPMCGVPHHALDTYLARLIKQGFRVAICDQVEDARQAKGLVRREVVRVVSPGTFTDAQYLDSREPAFLLGLVAGGDRDATIGAALLDLSTGEFTTTEYRGPEEVETLAGELSILRPREVVVPDDFADTAVMAALRETGVAVTTVAAWSFESHSAHQTLCEQLRASGLAGFGLDGHPSATRAAGGLVRYLRDTQKVDLVHLRGVSFRERTDTLLVDPITLKHLEVVTGADGGRPGSLLDEIDRTCTSMGARLLRAWLLRPLIRLQEIQHRLDAVEELAFLTTERGKLRATLKAVADLERLVARVALGSAGPRDLVALGQSLAAVPRLRLVIEGLQTPLVRSLTAELDDLDDVRQRIDATIVDEPPALVRDGGVIDAGVDPEIDELRHVSRSGKQIIAELEGRERQRTRIGSLKVRYNRVFGYYIEVSKSNLHAVPDDYIRKQTVAGGERFITPELKEHERRVLGADERLVQREIEIFEELRAAVAAEAVRIQATARALAALDVLAGLAETATLADYVKPYVHDGDELVITNGRHPVVEKRAAGSFVPNDLQLDNGTRQLMILTGPNMGGKSTYLRQTALICLLAQAGSFVPASGAKVAITDRLFARVGASDNIARGQSTFMVEMQETANILHSATSRSLVVLDEIGRGTSTFDGLSIAWATAEYLATNPRVRPKTLFATHYHELTDLPDALPGIVNYHVTAHEWRDNIVFLHKIEPGRSDRSYGIQVARLAGLPPEVLSRAQEILSALEQDEVSRSGRPSLSSTPHEPQQQLGLFRQPGSRGEAIVERLESVDPDQLTPLEALSLVAELKRHLRDEG